MKKMGSGDITRRRFTSLLLLGAVNSACSVQQTNPPEPVPTRIKQRSKKIIKPGYIELTSKVPRELIYGKNTGKDSYPYEKLDSSKVEVIQFFHFYCTYCYDFNLIMNKWLEENASNVIYTRESPPLNPSWKNLSQTYYAMQYMKLTDGLFDLMFEKAEADRRWLKTPRTISLGLKELDSTIDADKLESTMNSFAVVYGQLKRALNLAYSSNVTAVPSVLVGRKYLTSPKIAGSYEGMISAIDDLMKIAKL